MNNKITFLLLLVVVIIGTGIVFYWQQTLKEPPISIYELISFHSSIRGCAEKNSAETSKSVAGTEKEPLIEVNGINITYSRSINHLCCRKVSLSYSKIYYYKEDKYEFNIYEDWSGLACKCICFSEIESTIERVPPGNYAVNVYEKDTEPTSSKPWENLLIIARNVTIT